MILAMGWAKGNDRIMLTGYSLLGQIALGNWGTSVFGVMPFSARRALISRGAISVPRRFYRVRLLQ